ncbi:MAG: hypothetical protein ACFFCT_00070 [Candidatus Odinarchaeota archaeon]
MDIDRQNLIVPVTTTRRLQLAGGQPMEQAVPEDYVTAAMALRAMERREGRFLEFILKGYLPVAIVSSHQINRFFFVELLGLTSESILKPHKPAIQKILEKVKKASTSEEMAKCIQTARYEINLLLESTNITIVGLFAGLIARGVTQILDRPSGSSAEDYAVILTGIIDSSEFDKSIHLLQETSETLRFVETNLPEFIELTISKIDAFVGAHQAEAQPALTRLDLRVQTLEQQIESLESQRTKIAASTSPDRSAKLKEIDSTIRARRAALERDIKRQSEIVTDLDEIAQELIIGRDELHAESQRAITEVRNQLAALSDMLVSARFDDSGGKKKSIIMIPFFIAGFSKKDQLHVEVYPISHFSGNGERVGRRKDFVDIFLSPSRAIDALSALLEDRANNDVAFRKFIRDSSKDHNLLSDSKSRELIVSGAKSLLGDALVKRSLLDELDTLLLGLPETKSPRKRRRVMTPTISDDSLCAVKFHVQNEAGKPVQGAELELGALLITSDNNGVATTSLPKSHYEGIVKAPGYIEKTVEFSISSTDDVVIPIVVVPLAHEEQLALRLDELVERARRLDIIRERLWEAFEKQGTTLLGIPAYRSALFELLSELGYEPEAWITEAKQKTGMVKRLLKRDNRIDGLRRDILRMAEESKNSGGIMLYSELLVRLDTLGWSTGPEEIEGIINDMSKEGLIRGLSPLESGALLVEFVPVALTNDPQSILNLAARNEGKLTIEDAVIGLGWNEERVRNALNLLISNGVAKEQRSYSKSTQYFFPGLKGGKK